MSEKPEFQFITDVREDPFCGRTIFLIYGPPKIGKTTLLLKLLEQHPDQMAYYLSADKGLKKLRDENPEYFDTKFKGRLAWGYPNEVREYRSAMRLMEERIKRVLVKKRPRDVWAVLDTATHMQLAFLTESRKMSVSKAMNPKGARIEDSDEYARDLITQVDYNTNVGLMSEITNDFMRLPCNVVLFALEKYDGKEENNKIAVPALSGQSREKIVGDVDVIGRMVIDDEKNRFIRFAPGQSWNAGDRTGKLSEIEQPDLWAIQQKIMS